MKKAIFLFVYLAAMFCSFAQETPSGDTNPLVTKEDFLKKSKGQRTGAIVLISAGGAMAIAGFGVALNDFSNDLGNIFSTTEHTSGNNSTLATVLIIAGVGAMLGSIGLFVSAHKYKRKALSLSLKNEMAPQLQRSMVFCQPVPSLSLKISL